MSLSQKKDGIATQCDSPPHRKTHIVVSEKEIGNCLGAFGMSVTDNLTVKTLEKPLNLSGSLLYL